MKTLITGATGFVGSHLLEALLKTREKQDIYCLVRRDSSCEDFRRRGLNALNSPLEDNQRLSGLLKGLDIEVVYHIAASARINLPRDEYLASNIEGTRNLMSGLKNSQASLKKVIYMSSIHADDGHTSQYGMSKRVAEQEVISSCAQMNVPYCIVRPPIVYGPGNKEGAGVMRFASAIKEKKLFSRLNFPGACSLVYIEDLVKLCLLVEGSPASDNQTFYVCSQQKVGVDELMDAISRVLDADRKKLKLPQPFYRLPAVFLPALKRFFGFGADMADTLGLLLNDSWTCDMSKTTNTTGFKAGHELEAGLQKTFNTQGGDIG